MKRRSVVLLSCVIAVATLAAGAAHTPVPQSPPQSQQRPVFRSGAVFVSVDAYPRKDEKVVEGLTKADFEISEDGKPQSVEQFEFIRVSPITSDDERRDPTSIADSNRQAADPRNRVFVVYLDIFNTTLFGGNYARAPIVEFLNRSIGQHDLFAVMTPELPVTALTFARRSETLDAELRKHGDWAEGPDRKIVTPRNQYEGRLMVCGTDGEALVRAYRKDQTVRSVEQMIDRLGGLRDERKNILFISEGWSLPAARVGASRSAYPSTPTIGVGPTGRLGMGTSMSGDSDRAWCDAQYAAYSGIDYATRFRELVNRAVRANVAFYPIDVGGLRAPTGGVPLNMAPVEMLRDLASGTDGRAVTSTNDLVAGVRRIADELSAFYLLGYYSSNGEADGRFRRIDVKVKQPGVKVSARRGYYAPTAEMRKAELEAASRPIRETTAVDLELGRLSRLRADARLYTSAVVAPSGFDVVVELAAAEMSRRPTGGTVTVRISPKGGGTGEARAEASLEPGMRGVLVKVPSTEAGAQGWRIRARVEGGEEPLDDEIALASPAPVAWIGEPTVFRGGAGPRSPLRPVADFKFFRTERVRVEWTLSKPIDDRTARLLSRRGDAMPVPVTLVERVDGGRTVLAADVILAPLADGDYVIEATVTASGEKIQKLLAFRVVR